MKCQYLEKGSSEVCELVLRSLPDWFGIEEATASYINKVKEFPMIVAMESEKPVGFISIKRHSDFTYEVYVMGVVPECHRKGVGRKLLVEAENLIADWDADYFQVKTVSEDRECEFYKKTRLFYKSFGFKEVEVFPTLWDEHNPCLLLIKNVDRNEDNVERVVITPYKKEWQDQFDKVQSLLSTALGDLVFSIDHIGSTSVPGLAAKDRVDVQITVRELNDNFKEKFDSKLIKGGFQKSHGNYTDHRPPGDESPKEHWEKYFIHGTHPGLSFRSNIHVRVLGRENQKYPLLFRDYLRAHSEAMKGYEMLKKELSRYHPFDRIAYCEIKDPGCDLIMVSAKQWAQNTGWTVEKAMESVHES